jgi:hypothetical protein
LLVACPQCGQRNRLLYERLGQIFRCGKCHTELRMIDGAGRAPRLPLTSHRYVEAPGRSSPEGKSWSFRVHLPESHRLILNS